jgi:inosine/xanthosine triphosphatase
VTPGPLPNPLALLGRVRVGSTNEPKIAAVRSAFEAYAPQVAVEGAEVRSGVSDQPVGFDEIVLGARNRAAAAHRESACDFGVGIEDGLVAVPLGDGSGAFHHVNIGCAAITDGRRFSLGFTSGFAYPPEVSGPAVRDREPIGALFDRLWRERRDQADGAPSPRTTGNVGKLTGGVLPRSEYARHAVLCALVAFLHPDLYADSGARP